MAQALLMAAYRTQVQEALHLAAPLMAQLTHTGGVNYVAVFTGITPARFQELKAEFQRLRTAQTNPQKLGTTTSTTRKPATNVLACVGL